MAEAQGDKTLTLSEQYHLKGNEEKANVGIKPEEVKEVQNPENAASKEVVADKAEETPAAAAAVASEESSGSTPTAVGEESTEDSTGAAENSSEAATEESSENTENSGEQEVEEETPEVKLETAPADFRFPTTNQTRHCFTRYVEYHRCVAAKGEGAPECEKFAKYYRSLCPGEWVERWNEQRENGTFPGPL